MWTTKPQASLKLVLAPTGLTRDNGSGAMPKLHKCRLAHAHLVFALVITNRITLWAHFVHTYMDTPPLTTYMYMYMLYTILLVSWPSPYTVAFSLYSGLLPIQLAFSLYCWPSLKVFIFSMHGITCSTLLSLLSTERLSTVVLQA